MVNEAAGEPGEAPAAEPDGAHEASRRRTLLMVTPYFPPDGGGLEQYAFRLAIQLQRQHNWRVVVVTSGDRRSPERREIADGLTIYRLGYIFKISNTPLDPRWVRRLRSIIEQENPEPGQRSFAGSRTGRCDGPRGGHHALRGDVPHEYNA